MRKRLTVVLLLALFGVGIALAAQLGPIQVQSEQPVIVNENGQTLEMTAVGVAVSVELDVVSATQVRGRVRRLGSSGTGTFRIFWFQPLKEKQIQISGPLEEQFSLEGGDTDKKSNGQVH